jgi:hypothetical protein
VKLGRLWCSGPRKKREGEKGVGPVGLKWFGRKGKGFAFSENNSNTSIQIRIQEFKFEPNNKQ